MYFGCRFWDWGGALCILDGLSDIAYREFDALEDILLLGWVFVDIEDFFVFWIVIRQFGMIIWYLN